MNVDGARSRSCSPTTPSSGPGTRPVAIRNCAAAHPSSILRISPPPARRSPDSAAPTSSSQGISGSASGDVPASSVGATAQKGELPHGPSGSSHASSPHRSALRSAPVCNLSGNGADSERPGPARRLRHALSYADQRRRYSHARCPPRATAAAPGGLLAARPALRRPVLGHDAVGVPPDGRAPIPPEEAPRSHRARPRLRPPQRRLLPLPPYLPARSRRDPSSGTPQAASGWGRIAHPYQRMALRSITPCSAGAAAPLSLAGSLRVASRLTSNPEAPCTAGCQPPADAVVPRRVRETEAEVRSARETAAEERHAVAELALKPALRLELTAGGRQPLRVARRPQPVHAAPRRARRWARG